MKIPSLYTLWQEFKRVILRFPLQFFIALLATALWIYLVKPPIKDEQLDNSLLKLLAICNLAFTLSLASDLRAEAEGYSSLKKWLFRLVTIIVATVLYFVLNPFVFQGDIFRLLFLAFAFHLLVAFAPFADQGSVNGFWQYNKTIFLRILTAGFYAAVLFAGIAVAFLAVDELFNINIRSEAYLRLFALVTVGFMTIFFLAGIPKNITELDQEQSYPKGLKIFTQYVLIPLMSIYLVILLIYEIKIVIAWELPKGLVSTLILGYAVFGILSLLLIYPIREKEGNGWIKLFSKFFYLMMVPLIVLLILAITKRVGNYGITEPRYILIVLAVWLSGITLYFLFSKKQNIKIIPISLCIITLLCVYGPQSASYVAKQSQLSRLKRLQKANTEDAKSEMQEVVRYLVRQHGLESLQSFVKQDLTAIQQKAEKGAQRMKLNSYDVTYQLVDSAYKYLKIEGASNASDENIALARKGRFSIDIAGYDLFIDAKFYETQNLVFDGKTFKIEKKSDSYHDNLLITINAQDTLNIDVRALGSRLALQRTAIQQSKNRNNNLVADSLMQIIKESKDYSFKFVATSISGSYSKSKKGYNWFEFEGYLLIKRNRSVK